MTKKIAVIAVRIAVEIEDDQGIEPALNNIRHVLNQAEEESRIGTWSFDEWGADSDEPWRHTFNVDDDFDSAPQIRGRAVTLV